MQLGFYPGCSLKGTSAEYSISTLALAKACGVSLVEIDDWNCCGATAAHSLNHELSLSLPARVLALAKRQGVNEIVVPCAACYNRLCSTLFELNAHDTLRQRIETLLDLPVDVNIQVINVMQFIEKYILPALPEKVVLPFERKVACYYGCLLVRPHGVLQFDRLEDPQSMERVMQAIGAQTLNWGFKTECCGAGLSVSRTDIVANLSGKILMDAVDRGAQAVIVACPMCHSNLDMRRPQINAFVKAKIDIPALYITQAIGLAIGLKGQELGLNRHFVVPQFS